MAHVTKQDQSELRSQHRANLRRPRAGSTNDDAWRRLMTHVELIVTREYEAGRADGEMATARAMLNRLIADLTKIRDEDKL